jgi:hypothetical protein
MPSPLHSGEGQGERGKDQSTYKNSFDVSTIFA